MLAVGVLDRRQRLVRLLRVAGGVVELDVVGLGAADDRLLLLGEERVPGARGRAGTSARRRSCRRPRPDPRRPRWSSPPGRRRRGSRCRRRTRAGRGRRSSGTRPSRPRRPPSPRIGRAAAARTRSRGRGGRRGCGRADPRPSRVPRAPHRASRRTDAVPSAASPRRSDPTPRCRSPPSPRTRRSRSRNETFFVRSATLERVSRMRSIAPGASVAVSTRKIASCVSGASTCWGSIGTRPDSAVMTEGYLSVAPHSASEHGAEHRVCTGRRLDLLSRRCLRRRRRRAICQCQFHVLEQCAKRRGTESRGP